MSSLKKVWEMTLDALFPSVCLGCQCPLTQDNRNAWLCTKCKTSVPLATAFTCPQCKARNPRKAKRCHSAPFRLAAATPYAHPLVRALIWKLKYEHQRAAAAPLALWCIEHLATLGINTKPWTLVPIPLHTSRERERGFNQSREIADTIAQHIKAPIEQLLIRTRATSPQAEIATMEERLGNVAGSFALASQAQVKGKRILLIDDVYTSGATATNAVKVLRSAGAGEIIVLVSAHA